jgi:hypothetical protein
MKNFSSPVWGRLGGGFKKRPGGVKATLRQSGLYHSAKKNKKPDVSFFTIHRYTEAFKNKNYLLLLKLKIKYTHPCL